MTAQTVTNLRALGSLTSGSSTPAVKPIAHLGCDYDEFKPETYRGITLDFEDYPARYYSGRPYADRYLAEEQAKKRGYTVIISSSWDNMVTDAMRYFVGDLAKEEHVVGGSGD